MSNTKRNFKLERQGNKQWIVMNDDAQKLDIPAENVTLEHIQAYLDAVGTDEDVLKVVSCELVSDGTYLPAADAYEGDTHSELNVKMNTVHDLPEFYDVRVTRDHKGTVETFYLLVPTTWNGRLITMPGMGLRTMEANFANKFEFLEIANYYYGIKGHFSTIYSDGANMDPRMYGWALNDEDGTLKTDVLQNAGYLSGHWRAVVGKAVTEAITGSKPEYSYMVGASGGGRECVANAERYPGDHDGILAFAPAVDFVRMNCFLNLPLAVMNAYGNVVSLTKQKAFQQAVFAKYGGKDEWAKETRPTFDANECVGMETEDGPITQADADVMNAIWKGIVDDDGNVLYYNNPGVSLWGASDPFLIQMGFTGPSHITTGEDGVDRPTGFPLGYDYLKYWVKRDPSWDWTTLDLDLFYELFKKAIADEDIAAVATDHPDLTGFSAAGGKMIMTASASDDSVSPASIADYYDKAAEYAGGKDELLKSVRLFKSYFNGHGHLAGGAGVTTAEGMIALMKWVEDGIAPESMKCDEWDFAANCNTNPIEVPVY